jgi:Zn finger protein HypA/HybF involved in hydrogenase expression
MVCFFCNHEFETKVGITPCPKCNTDHIITVSEKGTTNIKTDRNEERLGKLIYDTYKENLR